MRRWVLLLPAGIIALSAIVWYGSGMLASRAAARYLREHDIAHGVLDIAHVGVRSASIRKAELGKDNALVIEDAHIAYRPDAASVAIQALDADKVTLALRLGKDKGKHVLDMGGLEALFGLSPQNLRNHPDALTLSAYSSVKAEHVAGDAPAQWRKAEGRAEHLRVAYGALALEAKDASWSVAPQAQKDTLMWKFSSPHLLLRKRALPLMYPLSVALHGSCNISRCEGEGVIRDKARIITLMLRATVDKARKQMTVQWNAPSFHIGEGKRSLSAISPMLASMPALKGSFNLVGRYQQQATSMRLEQTLEVERAEMAALMQAVLKDDIAIKGDMAGSIPMRWNGKGAVQVVAAELYSLKPGVLNYDPLQVSGMLAEHPHASMALEALRDFHYQSVRLQADSDARGELKGSLRMQGANPAFFAGKAVDFTLNLKGNVLSLLESKRKINDAMASE